jgi:hypothetical protein
MKKLPDEGLCRECNCLVKYKRSPKHNNLIKRKFCEDCARIRRMGSLGKSVVPMKDRTKEDLFGSRSSWQSARTAIRWHANSVMTKAGVRKSCAICDYTNHVELCHIKAVKEFLGQAKLSEINNTKNLVYLCPNHHWEYDNGVLSLMAETGVEPDVSRL